MAEGSKVIPKINQIRNKFNKVVFTRDWHPANHISFFTSHKEKRPFESIEILGKKIDLWPPHCV